MKSFCIHLPLRSDYELKTRERVICVLEQARIEKVSRFSFPRRSEGLSPRGVRLRRILEFCALEKLSSRLAAMDI